MYSESYEVDIANKYVVWIHTLDAQGIKTVMYRYTTDTWDEIKDEHKPFCAVLDAAYEPSDEGSDRVQIDGVGWAEYYPSTDEFIPPSYDLYIQE
jgi:hypothetical protein